jgi:hypothetical protein
MLCVLQVNVILYNGKADSVLDECSANSMLSQGSMCAIKFINGERKDVYQADNLNINNVFVINPSNIRSSSCI